MTTLEKLFDDAFGFTAQVVQSGFPFYNVIFDKEQSLTTIEIAVAGYDRSELSVTTEKDVLTIEAIAKPDELSSSYYHTHGISHRNFKRNFMLKPGTYIESVNLKNGILSIQLKVEIPEEHKRKTYSIK